MLALAPFQGLVFAPDPTALTSAPFTSAQYRDLDRIFRGLLSDIHVATDAALREERKKAYRAAFYAGAAGVIAALVTGTIAVRMVGRSADIARRKEERRRY